MSVLLGPLLVGGVILFLTWANNRRRLKMQAREWRRYVAAHNEAVDRWPNDNGDLERIMQARINACERTKEGRC